MKQIARILSIVSVLLLVGCHDASDPAAPYAHLSAKDLFAEGDRQLANHSYSKAIKAFNALEILYPFSEYTAQGQLEIIFAYYQRSEMASVVASADHFIRLHPRHPHVDYAFYMKGLANFYWHQSTLEKMFPADNVQRDMTASRRAFYSFRELVTRFPDSPFAPDAWHRMVALRNILAHHELLIADYYYSRKAYVAAANRAGYIIDHFQQAPETADALGLMAHAYFHLNLPDKAHETLDILRKNYPDSPAALESYG